VLWESHNPSILLGSAWHKKPGRFKKIFQNKISKKFPEKKISGKKLFFPASR